MANQILVRFDSSRRCMGNQKRHTFIGVSVNREETSLLTSLDCTVSKYSRMIFVPRFLETGSSSLNGSDKLA